MKEERTVQDLIYLISCAVNETVPEHDRIKTMDLPAVYDIAERHMLSVAAAMALESSGYRDAQTSRIIAESIRCTAIFDAERVSVLQKLEEAGIWYMPLKGSVLKDLYPRYGMRQMADVDILVDAARTEDVRTIMEGLGFSYHDDNCDYHDAYYKPPVSCFEMHLALFADTDSRGQLNQYYCNVQKRLLKDENNTCGYHFSDDDFYIHMVAHVHKHFCSAGTGLRSLLDIYVFLKKKRDTLDWTYIFAELKKLGIAEFEEKNRNLALHLFSGGETLQESDGKMLDFILSSGTFGTTENSVRNQVRRLGRMGFFIHRSFPPYKTMVKKFPVLKKIPLLLPFCWLLYIFKTIYNKRKKILPMFKGVFKSD